MDFDHFYHSNSHNLLPLSLKNFKLIFCLELYWLNVLYFCTCVNSTLAARLKRLQTVHADLCYEREAMERWSNILQQENAVLSRSYGYALHRPDDPVC